MGLQATNAGIDFQQRVSAYMMILMEFDMDISLALQVNKSNTIKEINFELVKKQLETIRNKLLLIFRT